MSDTPLYDFHTHSTLSDGALCPSELIRRVHVLGYRAVAITDHIGSGGLDALIEALAADCALAETYWDIECFPGVELTHVPPAAIGKLAARARQAGAAGGGVHGQTIPEPVAAGTNRAAVTCPDVDVLAHPGLITAEEVRLAAEHGVCLELSARAGHGLANGHVARLAREYGAPVVINSDGHRPGEFLTPEVRRQVALGAGLREDALKDVIWRQPQRLLAQVRARRAGSPADQPALVRI